MLGISCWCVPITQRPLLVSFTDLLYFFCSLIALGPSFPWGKYMNARLDGQADITSVHGSRMGRALILERGSLRA